MGFSACFLLYVHASVSCFVLFVCFFCFCFSSISEVLSCSINWTCCSALLLCHFLLSYCLLVMDFRCKLCKFNKAVFMSVLNKCFVQILFELFALIILSRVLPDILSNIYEMSKDFHGRHFALLLSGGHSCN